MAGRWGTLIGQKFNMLTILSFNKVEKDKRIWNAICDCGNSKLISTAELKKVRSCGCLSKKYFHNLVGQSFNENMVIGYIGQNKQLCHMYKFQCKCGKTFESEGNDVKSGKIKSCGCRWNSFQIINVDREKTIHNMIYSQYKKAAEDRGHSFALTKEEVKSLVLNNCHYCNGEPSNKKYNTGHKTYWINYNGIDRLDNRLGYEMSNVVTACKYCNQAKHTMTPEYFKEFLNRIFKAKENKHGFWKDDEENNGQN